MLRARPPILVASLVALVTLLAPAIAQALPVTPTFNWRAAAPGATPTSQWDATIGSHQWTVTGASNADPGSALPGITSSYGQASGDDITGVSFQSIAAGDPSNEDVSLELWFRPDSMAGGQQVLFETGGNQDGLSLLLDDNELFVRVKDNGSVATTARVDLGTDASEFFQAAITLSLDGTLSLYVDGLLATSTLATNVSDWTNSNGAGLGTRNGQIGGNQGGDLNGYGDFLGEIAIFRFYRDQVLTAGEVLQNFDAVATPEPGTAIFVALGLVGIAARRRQLRTR